MKLFVGAKALVVYDNKVLILREASYDEGTNSGKWGVPGGRIHDNEPILAGLKREVFEESGLKDIRISEVLGVYETFPTIKGEECHIVRVYYKAFLDVNSEVVLSGDHDAFEWVTLESVENKAFVSDEKDLVLKVLRGV